MWAGCELSSWVCVQLHDLHLDYVFALQRFSVERTGCDGPPEGGALDDDLWNSMCRLSGVGVCLVLEWFGLVITI